MSKWKGQMISCQIGRKFKILLTIDGFHGEDLFELEVTRYMSKLSD